MTVLPATQSRNDEAPGAFDPLARVFIALDARPLGVVPIATPDLSPFQRALLAIDGTVTQFIEAWAVEPVEVVLLEQSEIKLPLTNEWLALEAGAPVIRRRVMLRGLGTGRFHTWADSLIAAGRVSPAMRRALERDGGGIGKILIDAGVESRREALWYGRERPREIPPQVAACWTGDFLVRSYRLLAGGQPLMLITERFPL